jgi:hypothetical protein
VRGLVCTPPPSTSKCRCGAVAPSHSDVASFSDADPRAAPHPLRECPQVPVPRHEAIAVPNVHHVAVAAHASGPHDDAVPTLRTGRTRTRGVVGPAMCAPDAEDGVPTHAEDRRDAPEPRAERAGTWPAATCRCRRSSVSFPSADSKRIAASDACPVRRREDASDAHCPARPLLAFEEDLELSPGCRSRLMSRRYS